MKIIKYYLPILFFTLMQNIAFAVENVVVRLEGVANQITNELQANKDKYVKDQEAMRVLVDKNLVPIIDRDYIVNYIMLPFNWRELTAEQREEHNKELSKYRAALTESLTEYAIVSNYQKVLDNYDGGVFVFSGKIKKISATDAREVILVPASFMQNNARYTVDFRMMRNLQRDGDNAEWFITDVVVEGVSLLITYRDMVQQCLQAKNTYQQIVNALDSSDSISCR